MFETDFPHPTSLHPNPLGIVKDRIDTLRPETQRKVMGGNAEKLYRLTWRAEQESRSDASGQP